MVADPTRSGGWLVRHHGQITGSVQRRTTTLGRPAKGWRATWHGQPVHEYATAKGFYRSRDLAAASVALTDTRRAAARRRRRKTHHHLTETGCW